ncbi:tetratricopeptide repeat protein [Maribellus mangrovi]|uniref:type IX secretion system periplasmic lipoprotein PorW/SprE n=1 Tax=Maribellus mangrovi TaxID=3133146 RepID=UPI0030EC1221
MKRLFLHTTIFIFLVAVFAGCSTEKNTRASRTFHNVTSKYNIYFNAKESVKAGLASVDERIENDYTHILPIYKESDPSAVRMVKSDMDYAVAKCSKLIEIHSITKKPKRKKRRTRKYQEFASQEEFNKWIDDSYLLMGKAYFYQQNYYAAIDNFSYVVRKYPQEETASEAQVFLIRAYTELERYIEANEVIQAVQTYEDFPKKYERELALATANYYMKQEEYGNAIKMLDIAIQKTFWRKDKARYQYIIAQLYKEMGENEKALEAFRTVARTSPDYAMAFNAKINSAGVFSGEGNAEDLRKELNKMLRDKKNIDFRDQIYFALGNLDLREGDREEAKEDYKKSVASSFKNQYQRAFSAITLADLYFEDQEYRGAQSYYDSAMIIIDDTYPDYKNVEARYTNLTHLVDNLLIVEREDSLQKVAQMPEKEREELIARLMQEEQERQRNMENLAMQGARSQGYYRSNRYRMGMGSSGGGGWYFYNPQTVSYGKVSFQQQWGRRQLEDDWRRSNKNTVTEYNEEELVQNEEEEQRVEDPLKKEFYTQDLPLTDSLMAVSHEKIRDALYNAGKIFKSEFEDYQRSAECFEDLNKRYPKNIYLLSAYFDLYDLYELMGDKEKANYYRDLLISDFPDSKYAQYLLNPNFFVEMEARLDSLNRLYQETFASYKHGQYRNVLSLVDEMKAMKPDSVIIPKIDFMQAIAQGTQTDVHQFEALLKGYLQIYPDKEPSPLATEILTLIEDSTLADYQKLVEMGYINEEIQNEELLERNAIDDEFGGKFTYEEDLLHYFVIAYPRKDEKKIDLNRLKFDIANYNIDHYTKVDYDIETENLNEEMAFVVVRSMSNKENALIYHGSIIRRAPVFQALKDVQYLNFVISSTNYRTVKTDESITDYLKFFIKNYSRFIRSNFTDEGPDISPEELMARAEAENNALKEKGTFVTVTTAQPGTFNTQVDTTQNFVLAVQDKGMSLRQLLREFADFNRDNFRAWNLALQLKQSEEYQLMVVQGIPALNESMSYFRRVVTTRSLFESLGQATYRNFLITDENLQTLIDEDKVDEYITFFRKNYIQRPTSSSTGTSSGAIQTNTTSTTATAAGTQTTAEPEEYKGPYNENIEGEHKVVFVVPKQGIVKAAFISGLEAFNEENFPGSGFNVREQSLDDFRNLIIIEGIADQETARQYFSNVVRKRELFDPLGTAEYRNFLISNENFNIFYQQKNIVEYMDFYKKVYLGN